MFYIFGWFVYGLLCGSMARFLHPGKENMGCLATVGIGVAGSFVGGFVNWMIGNGTSPFSSSGIVMGILGATILCYAFGLLSKQQTPPSSQNH